MHALSLNSSSPQLNKFLMLWSSQCLSQSVLVLSVYLYMDNKNGSQYKHCGEYVQQNGERFSSLTTSLRQCKWG